MGTIAGVECANGVVIAGDKRAMSGGTVTSETAENVYEYGEVGVAVIGDRGGTDEFARQFEANVRKFRTEGESASITKLANVAADITEETGVDVIVAARDDDGTARIREVGSDGSVLDDSIAARGSGATVALGNLETADLDVDVDEAEALLRETLTAVAERDTETGDEIDVWVLENE